MQEFSDAVLRKHFKFNTYENYPQATVAFFESIPEEERDEVCAHLLLAGIRVRIRRNVQGEETCLVASLTKHSSRTAMAIQIGGKTFETEVDFSDATFRKDEALRLLARTLRFAIERTPISGVNLRLRAHGAIFFDQKPNLHWAVVESIPHYVDYIMFGGQTP